MNFARIQLQNWRNFLSVDVPLLQRMFLVGPNASGKSNFLDAFRFLRDIADPQGGLQQAVARRGGVSQLRSLHARRYSDVVIAVEVVFSDARLWTYRLEFGQDNQRRPLIKRESVRHGEEVVLERPDEDDQADQSRLTQTHLEQVNANKSFRLLQEGFAKIHYLHIVPQLVRDSERSLARSTSDPYGGDFLERLARTPKKTRTSRLRRIQEALQVAVPQLAEIELFHNERGVPHLRGRYTHWRPQGAWQTEDQFSDGTLRLLGLLWALLDGSHPLLLEEPELSLHAAVVRYVPPMMGRVSRKTRRQVLVSTHSADLLSDEGIAPEEVLTFEPSREDTRVEQASSDQQIRALLEGGLSIGDAVLPKTAPQDPDQLLLFGRL